MHLVVFAPEPEGGHPEYVAKLIDGLLRSRFGIDRQLRVTWPVRDDADLSRVAKLPPGVQRPAVISRMPKRSGGTVRWLLARLNVTRRHDFTFLRWLRRQRDVDVVLIEEVQRFTLPLLVRRAGKRGRRVIVHLHNIRRHDYRGSLLDKVDEWLVGRALVRADSVVVHSDANRARLHQIFGDGLRSAVVPHGLEVRSQGDVLPQVPSVLFFGVNRPEKGLSVLMDALELMPEPPALRIVGHTPEAFRAETTRLIAKAPSVTWVDAFVDDETVRREFTRASIVVLPYTRFDAQSGVLHLALEYGVPVVATSLGGIAETVDRFGNGIVVPPRDASAMASAIELMLDSSVNLRHRQISADLAAAQSWDVVGERLGEVLFASS